MKRWRYVLWWVALGVLLAAAAVLFALAYTDPALLWVPARLGPVVA